MNLCESKYDDAQHWKFSSVLFKNKKQQWNYSFLTANAWSQIADGFNQRRLIISKGEWVASFSKEKAKQRAAENRVFNYLRLLVTENRSTFHRQLCLWLCVSVCSTFSPIISVLNSQR